MPADAAPVGTKALQIPPDERRRRVEVIQGDPEFQARVGQAQALRFADSDSPAHVEQRIYDGFPNAADEARMKQFHQVDWGDRSALASQIEDPRLGEFARRLIYFERPEMLSQAQSAELSAWIANRVLTEDESVPWMTVREGATRNRRPAARRAGRGSALTQRGEGVSPQSCGGNCSWWVKATCVL